MSKTKTNKLNAIAKRKRKKKQFIVFASILFILSVYAGLQIASYRNVTHDTSLNFFNSIVPAFKDLIENPQYIFSFSLDFTTKATRESIFIPVIVAFFVIILLWYNDLRHMHDLAGVESGSSKWNDDFKSFKKDYSEPSANRDNTTILSKNVALSTNTRKTLRNNNVLGIGGTGSGKSRFLIKPNILQMNSNMVITDPSGELLESTGQALKNAGYKIKVFNLVEMDKSSQYNPFHYIRDDKGVMMMINCLIKNTTPPDQHGEKFWEDSETALLLALSFFLRDYCPENMQNFDTITELLRWAEVDERDSSFESKLDRLFLKSKKTKTNTDRQPGEDIIDSDQEFGNFLDKMIIGYTKDGKPIMNVEHKSLEELDTDGTSIAVKEYQIFKMGAGKTAKSILISCGVRLKAFNIPSIANLTNIDNIHLEELAGISDDETKRKQALFVIIPAADSTYNFLVSMMYSQLFETLYYIAGTNPKCVNQRLPIPVNFLLDEFANIGSIPEFTKKLSTMRKHDISCFIILQNIAQIKTQYKDDWETIIGNCDSLVFLGGKELTTCEYVSKELGEQTITVKNRSLSTSKGGASGSYNQTARPLLKPDELVTLPNNSCVVMIRGIYPFIDDKYDYLSHPRYRLTGDANNENKYINRIDNTKNTAENTQKIINSSCCIQKTNISELIESNPTWCKFPDVYVQFMKIAQKTLSSSDTNKKNNDSVTYSEAKEYNLLNLDDVDIVDNSPVYKPHNISSIETSSDIESLYSKPKLAEKPEQEKQRSLGQTAHTNFFDDDDE